MCVCVCVCVRVRVHHCVYTNDWLANITIFTGIDYNE